MKWSNLNRMFSFSEVIPYLLLFVCTVSALMILIFIKTSRQSISQWMSSQEISIFASADLTEDEKNTVTQTIETTNSKAQVEYLNQEQTKKMMSEELGLATDLPRATLNELIPNLFLVRGAFSQHDVEKLVEKIKALGGVEDVQWGSSWVQKLRPVVAFFEKSAWLLFGTVLLFFYLLISYLVLEIMKKDQNKYHIMSFLGATSFQIEILVFKKISLFLTVCFVSSLILVWMIIDLLQASAASTLTLFSGLHIQMLSMGEIVAFILCAFLFAFLSAKRSLIV